MLPNEILLMIVEQRMKDAAKTTWRSLFRLAWSLVSVSRLFRRHVHLLMAEDLCVLASTQVEVETILREGKRRRLNTRPIYLKHLMIANELSHSISQLSSLNCTLVRIRFAGDEHWRVYTDDLVRQACMTIQQIPFIRIERN